MVLATACSPFALGGAQEVLVVNYSTIKFSDVSVSVIEGRAFFFPNVALDRDHKGVYLARSPDGIVFEYQQRGSDVSFRLSDNIEYHVIEDDITITEETYTKGNTIHLLPGDRIDFDTKGGELSILIGPSKEQIYLKGNPLTTDISSFYKVTYFSGHPATAMTLELLRAATVYYADF